MAPKRMKRPVGAHEAIDWALEDSCAVVVAAETEEEMETTSTRTRVLIDTPGQDASGQSLPLDDTSGLTKQQAYVWNKHFDQLPDEAKE
eukprot:5291810-Lingulodinium_polyedra.AAC.1